MVAQRILAPLVSVRAVLGVLMETELKLLISDIYRKLDYIASKIDHNSQLWIDF